MPLRVQHSEKPARVSAAEAEKPLFLRVLLGADDHGIIGKHLFDFAGCHAMPGSMPDVGRVPVEFHTYSVNT